MHLLARRAFIVYSSSSEGGGGGGWRVGQLPPAALERRSRYMGRRPTSSASRPPTPHPLTAPTDRPKHSVRLFFCDYYRQLSHYNTSGLLGWCGQERGDLGFGVVCVQYTAPARRGAVCGAEQYWQHDGETGLVQARPGGGRQRLPGRVEGEGGRERETRLDCSPTVNWFEWCSTRRPAWLVGRGGVSCGD